MKKKIIIFGFILLSFFSNSTVSYAEKEGRLWQDETVYSILIDRFYNADQKNDYNVQMDDPEAYHGGDFQGIIDKLDYIKDMGFTTIALSPIFEHQEGSFHGYWVSDFYQIDKHFGTLADFKQLVREAHDQGMNVIIDFPINLVAIDHPWLSGLIVDENKQGQPTLNLQNDYVRQFLLDAAIWWINETDIDGYRLYSIDEVPDEFLQEFSKSVKTEKTNFYLLGHVQKENEKDVALFYEKGMDGVTDYSYSNELRKVFHKPNQSFSDLFSMLESSQLHDKNSAMNVTFLDNERMARFTRDMIEVNEHPGPRWRQALTFMYTTPGIPVVFYGTEIALDGEANLETQGQMNFRTDPELMEYVSNIGKLRSEYPSLTRGSIELLFEVTGMVIFKREYESETTVIAINNSTETKTATIPAQKLTDDMELRGKLNGDLVRSNNQQYTITIDRDESEIYVLDEKSGLNITYLLVLAIVLLSFFAFLYGVRKKSRQ